ncbi:MAG TPA: 2OG-Fe(II) oxygenase [Vitreimonas sp.]|uniref:2OG-Fe(II) oxygenase n=1 Tax=Vitreimonas sp. TaxID=3069702 RepID=UPI002D3F21CF|nr:2OG-Fe(II) oxygenase [Vitreimonas sp.]HYD88762.1 2OG-Fe(II) oxygenase [Vitreimonas sp.]
MRESGDGQLEVLAGRHPAELVTPPAPRRVHERSLVFACDDFMPEGFADWFIASAREGLKPALVNNAHGQGVPDPMRTATMFQFGPERIDVLGVIMQHRAAHLFGLSPLQFEPPNVLSYEPGQSFDYHCDFVDPAVPLFARELQTFGQRVATVVTYLNADFTEGETDFPDLGIRFRGAPGDAVAFSNVMSNGEPDRLTKHAGLPPTSGRKFALSQWARSKLLGWLR